MISVVSQQDFNDKRLSLVWSKAQRQDDDPKILDDYRQWVEQPLYMIMKNKDTGEYRVTKARKRGNELYARETITRFKRVGEAVRKLHVRTGRKTTSALLVTLTYRNNNVENWEQVGRDFNLFMSRLRKRYDGVKCVRIWEAHKSGFPHIHAVLLFERQRFECFTFRNKLRIKNKSDFALHWTHGFTDVLGVYNLEGAIGYLLKYLKKTLNRQHPHADITLARLWYHRKRAFSISNDLITNKRNSNQETRYIFIGICTAQSDLRKIFISYAEKTEKGLFLIYEESKQEVLGGDNDNC